MNWILNNSWAELPTDTTGFYWITAINRSNAHEVFLASPDHPFGGRYWIVFNNAEYNIIHVRSIIAWMPANTPAPYKPVK